MRLISPAANLCTTSTLPPCFHLEAADEKSAIDAAAKQFNIPPARRNKIAVTKISEKD
jgi:hypothetical protein